MHSSAYARCWRRLRPAHSSAAALLGVLALTGCGGVTPGHPTAGSTSSGAAATRPASSSRTTTTSAASAAPSPTTPAAGARARQSVVARIDASSDRIVAEGKVHIAAGAPSNAEIRHEIELARKAGIALPSGDSASSFESAQSSVSGAVAEAETPETVWNPRHKPIADWIVAVLEWAYLHGWRGTVTSGYRTFYEQAQLNAAGAFSARAGLSNHETTKYPGGAVDVTEPSALISVLRSYPGSMKLIGGVLGAVDPEHFSATGD